MVKSISVIHSGIMDFQNFETHFTFRVPEDKCHMVLPDIEEEDENHRLSLTSLLLGQIDTL